jgi:hypothetical protein
MKPYFEYVDIPDLANLSRNLLMAMPKEVKYGTIFAEYDPNKFLKDVPGLVDAVKLIRPWEELSVVALITQYPNTDCPIHVDGFAEENIGVALNIPVFNCENCYSIIYDPIGDSFPSDARTLVTDLPLRQFRPSQVKEVATITYKGHAVLINTSKPHTVVNPTLVPRIVASFRFSPPIIW